MHYLDNGNWPARRALRERLAKRSRTTNNANPLTAGLKRILDLATKALNGPASDTELLNALSAIQGASFQAEMEYHGPEEIDEDAPF